MNLFINEWMNESMDNSTICCYLNDRRVGVDRVLQHSHDHAASKYKHNIDG